MKALSQTFTIIDKTEPFPNRFQDDGRFSQESFIYILYFSVYAVGCILVLTKNLCEQ